MGDVVQMRPAKEPAEPEPHYVCSAAECDSVWFTAAVCLDAATGSVTARSADMQCMECGTVQRP